MSNPSWPSTTYTTKPGAATIPSESARRAIPFGRAHSRMLRPSSPSRPSRSGGLAVGSGTMALVLSRRKRRAGSETPEDIYRGLRSMVLDSVANGLALPPADHPDVSGVVVDIPAQGGFATVVALTDNTTSMYTSTGGGTIGAGEHVEVAAATHRVLSAVQAQLEAFTRKDDGDLPPAGSVRFHVLTPAGSRSEDVPEDSFWGRAPHQLMPMIVSVQELVTAIREASPQ
jgi:hypothetical protein